MSAVDLILILVPLSTFGVGLVWAVISRRQNDRKQEQKVQHARTRQR